MLGVFVALWLLLPAIAEVPDWPARQARTSAIACSDRRAVPDTPGRGRRDPPARGRHLPRGVRGAEAAPDVPAPPDSIVVASIVNDEATAAVFRVEAPACGRIQEGSGFTVAPGLIATNADVVAGSTDVSVHGEHGEDETATVVAFDPFRDVALLQVDGIDATPLPLAGAFSG